MEKKEQKTHEDDKSKKVETTLTSPTIESEEDKHKKKELKIRQNKQILWAIFFMVAIIVILLVTPYVRDNFFNKFSYHGIVFQKTTVGKLIFYTTKLPIYSQVSSLVVSLIDNESQANLKQTGIYVLNFRNDPRKLNNITVDLDVNNMTFVSSNTVYVTYNVSDPICDHNVVAAADLANFLINFGNFKVNGALMNKDYAEAKRVPYATCSNNPDNTVILVLAGNESKISKISKRCYEIEYANCEISQATDKFILSMVEGYMNLHAEK
jgi:hypothetical protein